jgi:N-acetylmuramoyl-L-alanine amidase
MTGKLQLCSCPAPTMIRATGGAQPGHSGMAFGELRRREAIAALLGIGLLPLIGGGPALSTQSDVPLIVLDPGHGGHDPGAIGLTGLFEKHIALDTAKALKLALEKSGQYRVMLTRDQDVFIPLDQRRSVADAQAASLFVSLHADALHDHAVRGASVYTSSLEASDGQSDELAQRENSVDPAAMAEYRSYSPEVANILASLAERETHYFSSRLQRNLVRALSTDVLMLHNPARRANFVVLRSFDTPSVLVEMGFMSNETDERLLQSDRYRTKVVAALCTGIESCMNHVIGRGRAG